MDNGLESMGEQDDQPQQSDGKAGTTLSIKDYPELKGAEEGQEIKGTWTGTVQSVDGDNVTISYTDLQLQTENAADKEYAKMTGKKKKKMAPALNPDQDEI